jgi:hypothetical protein
MPEGFQPMRHDDSFYCSICKAHTDHTTRQHRDSDLEKIGKEYISTFDKGYEVSQDQKERIDKAYDSARPK